VEWLLNGLVKAMPVTECYVEVGTLEGRTLDAAAAGNSDKTLIGIDPCEKYETMPKPFPDNVRFLAMSWQQFVTVRKLEKPIGVCFYDGDHSSAQTRDFMHDVRPLMATEAVLVLDDWDRETVRKGAFEAMNSGWKLLRECPSYGDGLTCPQDHFGWSFGVALFGFRR